MLQAVKANPENKEMANHTPPPAGFPPAPHTTHSHPATVASDLLIETLLSQLRYGHLCPWNARLCVWCVFGEHPMHTLTPALNHQPV